MSFAFKTIDNFNGAERVESNYDPGVTINVPYQVDDSRFSPTSAALKQIIGQSIPDNIKSKVYDFVDGNGKPGPLPAGRNRSNFIPEIQAEIKSDLPKRKKVESEFNSLTKAAQLRDSYKSVPYPDNTSNSSQSSDSSSKS